jgi:hypothetical protein
MSARIAFIIGTVHGLVWGVIIAMSASAEIVRVDCNEVAYAQHWDTSEEALARGGFNGGPYTLGKTFLSMGDDRNVEWEAMSGTLPLRLGIKLEGTELVIHKDSTRQANDCFDWINGSGTTNYCYRSPDRDENGNRLWESVGDNRLWITAEGKPTSLNFVPNDATIPYHSWTMYPMVCREEEESLGFCSRLDPCIFNDIDAGEFGPCEDTTINVHTIGEMRTTWRGNSQQGGGRWAGVVTPVLGTAVNVIGIRVNTTFSDFPFSSPGIHRNLRVRFYDDNLNEIKAHVVRSDVEAPRWDPPYRSMFMDGIEQCYATTDDMDSIRVVIIDSVDGQRWSLRGLYTDPSYQYDLAHHIPMTPCEPPIAGLQRDWEPDTGTYIRDPSPHVSNHIFNFHAASHHTGDHDPSEEICGGMGLTPEQSMTCYCSPTPDACCAALAGEPIPPVCEPLKADLDGDGVVGIPDFNILRSQWGQ